MEIGDRIRTARQKQNISQKRLADSLRMPSSTLANYEMNRRKPNIGTVLKIADVLGLSITDLLEDSSKEAQQIVANVFGVPAEMLEVKTLQDYTDQELLQEIARRMSNGQV
jgi:transcriptional regulator with XRE-family HTH domain